MIKEFIQHMCVLHHNINWLVIITDLRNNNSSVNSSGRQTSGTNTNTNTKPAATLCKWVSQVSVAKRLIQLHGISAVHKLQVNCANVANVISSYYTYEIYVYIPIALQITFVSFIPCRKSITQQVRSPYGVCYPHLYPNACPATGTVSTCT